MAKNKEIIGNVQWYLQTDHSMTFQSLVEFFGEDITLLKKCSVKIDGKERIEERKLWPCTYKVVCLFLNNKSSKNLEFTVHKQVGNSSIKQCFITYSKLRLKKIRYA